MAQCTNPPNIARTASKIFRHWHSSISLRPCLSGLLCPLLPSLSFFIVVALLWVMALYWHLSNALTKILSISLFEPFIMLQHKRPTSTILIFRQRDIWFCEWERKFLSIVVAQLLNNDLHKRLLVMAKDEGEGMIVQAPLTCNMADWLPAKQTSLAHGRQLIAPWSRSKWQDPSLAGAEGLRRGGWGGGGGRLVQRKSGSSRLITRGPSPPSVWIRQSFSQESDLTSDTDHHQQWWHEVRLVDKSAAAAVKEGAGEDGEAREALDQIKISICPRFKPLEICHWTSSSHPHPPPPLHGQLKLQIANYFLKGESRL